MTDIVSQIGEQPGFLADLTSAIQFGFISGTLVFAFLTIADRFSPSRVFFISALFAGVFNLGLVYFINGPNAIFLVRLLTGFFLAGIYPVGMKIASDHFRSGLGKSLGFLVGALVLGTSLPHLLKAMTFSFDWTYVVYATSFLSFIGGLLILLFVPDGPYRKPAQKMDLAALTRGFRFPRFRAAAFGYFGHMWELYTFWAFVPVILTMHNKVSGNDLNIPLLSFLVIASGAPACVLSGWLSQRWGLKKGATVALATSGTCCLLSPLFLYGPSFWLILFLLVWGMSVIADSPLFSTLVAENAPLESKGSSLTIVNCIGFSITILSIQCLNYLSMIVDHHFLYMFLAIGPALSLFALMRLKR